MTPLQYEDMQLGAVVAFLVLGGCALWWTVCIGMEAWAMHRYRQKVRQRLEELTRARIAHEVDLTVERLAARAECQRAYPRVARRRR